MISQLLTRKLRVLPIKSRLLRWRSLSLQQGKKSVISSTVLLPIFLVMTHSSTLYEREVGDGLVVNSEKKKRNRETHFPPQGITYQTSNRQNQNKTMSTVEEYCWESYWMVTLQDFIHRLNRYEPPCDIIINSSTRKYCSVAFFWMVTPQDFIYRLKSWDKS